MAKTMFDKIKKQNGEHFAKAIRNYDNGIFDIPNLDEIVKYAGREAEPIMNFLISLKGIHIEEMGVHEDPVILLKKAGYNAYVADTVEKQNAIKKYFAPGEELCTFRDSNRYQKYFIINAVREDVDEIERSEKPEREDKYGTSVISIQVLKSGGFISIKNRYNHTVQNPDNTFNSNPDNIIPGLSDALKHYFGVDFSSQKTQLPDGYMMIGKQICKTVNEKDGVIYLSDSAYVKDGIIHEIDKNSEILLPMIGALLNAQKQEITFLSDIEPSSETERFAQDIIKKNINGKKITFVKNNEKNTKDIYVDGKLNIRMHDNMECYVSADPYAFYATEISIDDGVDWKNYKEEVTLEDISLSNMNIDCVANRFSMYNGSVSSSVLDLSHVKDIELVGVNLSGVTVKFNPNADTIRLINVVGLSGYLDFGNVKDLRIRVPNSDRGLEKVHGINTPKNGKYSIENDVSEVRDRLPALQENFDKHQKLENAKKKAKISSATKRIKKQIPQQPYDTNEKGM